MLSLENAFSEAEARDFEERLKRFLRTSHGFDYVVEPKMDGVAVELVTRGGASRWVPPGATATGAKTSPRTSRPSTPSP